MLRKQKIAIYTMLKSENVHTCSNSKLYNHTQSCRITAGQQTIILFWPIVLHVWPPFMRYLAKFDLKFTVLA